jgi:hypothetical protein
MLLAQLNLPEGNNLLIYGGAAGAGLLLLIGIVVLLFRRKKPKVDPEAGMNEDLSTYPPAPTGRRHYQLSVLNHPVRLRLVVVAPVGRRPVGKVDSVLEQVLRGLGEVSIDDKPRIRVWPPQLSTSGFAPTFFRNTKKPEAEGKPSRWVLLAGPARAGGVPVLLALACVTDAPTTLGAITMSEAQWNEVLRVEHA